MLTWQRNLMSEPPERPTWKVGLTARVSYNKRNNFYKLFENFHFSVKKYTQTNTRCMKVKPYLCYGFDWGAKLVYYGWWKQNKKLGKILAKILK
jgi:hypothetical protein